jgi:hypothetical protein
MRRDAHPAEQPYVAAGATSEGNTRWDFWAEGGKTLGVQTTVRTSEAGFGARPEYQAHVVGDRVFALAGHTDIHDPTKNGALVDGFSQIVNPTRTSFVLRVFMPRDLPSGNYSLNPAVVFEPSALTDLQNRLKWYVVWLGVEG